MATEEIWKTFRRAIKLNQIFNFSSFRMNDSYTLYCEPAKLARLETFKKLCLFSLFIAFLFVTCGLFASPVLFRTDMLVGIVPKLATFFMATMFIISVEPFTNGHFRPSIILTVINNLKSLQKIVDGNHSVSFTHLLALYYTLKTDICTIFL